MERKSRVSRLSESLRGCIRDFSDSLLDWILGNLASSMSPSREVAWSRVLYRASECPPRGTKVLESKWPFARCLPLLRQRCLQPHTRAGGRSTPSQKKEDDRYDEDDLPYGGVGGQGDHALGGPGAVVLALTVGLASSALAGTGAGARFDLGKTNTVNAITKLVGSVAGPGLQRHAPEPSRKRRSRQCQTNHPR
jgi:hypothetical protein